jgi:hypothetical protein
MILFHDVVGAIFTGELVEHHDELVPFGARWISCV